MTKNSRTKGESPVMQYIKTLHAREDDLLARIRAKCVEVNRAWQVGAEEGKLLQVLLQLHGAKRVVELGTLFGYSTLWMARALPEGGKIHTLERDEAHAKIAQDFFDECEMREKISLHVGDAHKTLASLANEGPFDAIFIDADKPSYNAYLDWAEVNIRAGGLIIADNVLLFGSAHLDSAPEGIAKTTWAAMRKFNERLADSRRYHSIMIPTEEGLSVAIKRG